MVDAVVHPPVNHKAKQAAIWAGRGVFKAVALVGAFVLIIGLWLWDASVLTKAADGNLRLIREITRLLPPDWASKSESALRIFGADRALLLLEGVALAKLLMLAIAYPFRRRQLPVMTNPGRVVQQCIIQHARLHRVIDIAGAARAGTRRCDRQCQRRAGQSWPTLNATISLCLWIPGCHHLSIIIGSGRCSAGQALRKHRRAGDARQHSEGASGVAHLVPTLPARGRR